MSHLSFVVEATTHANHFDWIVFNRYTGAELRIGGATTRADAEAAARAAIIDLLK